MGDNRKVVIIAGAGATRSDATDKQVPKAKRPPLDKGFFREAVNDDYRSIASIKNYMDENYAVDILKDGDNLEQVMGTIYSDAVMPAEKRPFNLAEVVFFSLFDMFRQRIADTTNALSPDGGNHSRILGGYLGNKIAPEDITVITFNQDLQIEKAANLLHQNAKGKGGGAVFNFPDCYKMPLSLLDSGAGYSGSPRLFDKGGDEEGITILKLHGSLNWLAEHNSPRPTIRQSFLNRHRPLFVTRRTNIARLTIQKLKTIHTLPVIIPPVGHKAGILHTEFAGIWKDARQALRKADEIVVFGYSCPEQDKESENLIRGSLLKNEQLRRFSVIDPSPATIKRYADLTSIRHKCLHFYRDAGAFIGARFSGSEIWSGGLCDIVSQSGGGG